MQFRKILPLALSILSFSFLALGLYGQEVRVNDKGERIIVYEDGSWQYFSDLIQGNHAIYRQTPTDAGNFPVFGGQVSPMEGPSVNITEEYAQRIFIRKAQLAREAVAITKERAEKAQQQLEKISSDYEMARQKNSHPDELTRIERRLQSARQTAGKTAWEAQQAQYEYERADQRARNGNYIALLKQEQDKPRPSLRSDQETELLTGNFYDNLLDVEAGRELFRPGTRPGPSVDKHRCHFAFEGVDEYSGQKRRDVQKELLFTHTDENLRPYLRDKEYLRCDAFLSSIAGGFRFLSLQFTFAYPNAREAYGFIEEGSFLTIKLLNGEFVNLRAGKLDRGRYDTETGLLTYQVHYPIGANLLNLLGKNEMDTVMVFWSSGYEEYQVYNIDFFIHQLGCLE